MNLVLPIKFFLAFRECLFRNADGLAVSELALVIVMQPTHCRDWIARQLEQSEEQDGVGSDGPALRCFWNDTMQTIDEVKCGKRALETELPCFVVEMVDAAIVVLAECPASCQSMVGPD